MLTAQPDVLRSTSEQLEYVNGLLLPVLLRQQGRLPAADHTHGLSGCLGPDQVEKMGSSSRVPANSVGVTAIMLPRTGGAV